MGLIAGRPIIIASLVVLWACAEQNKNQGARTTTQNGRTRITIAGSVPNSTRPRTVTDTWTPQGWLDASERHTAVWTGAEMIVWGGGSFFNSGSRYDPSTDAWTPLPSSGAPSGRTNHAAVWTGSEMIIWGGFGLGPQPFLADGGRFDPSTDTWTPTSTIGAPAPKLAATAVWTGRELIVWGGYTIVAGLLQYTNTGGRYDPAIDNWVPVSTTGAPSARGEHRAIWTGTEMIVWGGTDGGRLNTGARYDPLTDNWTPISTNGVPSARFNHGALWTGTEMIVWGGNGYLNTGGRYDPSTDTWAALSTSGIAAGCEACTLLWTGDEMIVWGGATSRGVVDNGGRYRPSTDTWASLSPIGAASARAYHTTVWTGAEMIVWGGYEGRSTHDVNTGGRYSPSSDAWVPISTSGAPLGRSGHTAIWTGSEMVVWGGDYPSTGGRYALSTGT